MKNNSDQFTKSQRTMNAWTGMGGYYDLKVDIDLLGYKFVLWKKGGTKSLQERIVTLFQRLYAK